MESARAQARFNKFIMYLVLCIMAFIMLVPFAWMILTALKTNQEAISVDPFISSLPMAGIGKILPLSGKAITSSFCTKIPF